VDIPERVLRLFVQFLQTRDSPVMNEGLSLDATEL